VTLSVTHRAAMQRLPSTFTIGEAWLCSSAATLTVLGLMVAAVRQVAQAPNLLAAASGSVQALIDQPSRLPSVICVTAASFCCAVAWPGARLMHGFKQAASHGQAPQRGRQGSAVRGTAARGDVDSATCVPSARPTVSPPAGMLPAALLEQNGRARCNAAHVCIAKAPLGQNGQLVDGAKKLAQGKQQARSLNGSAQAARQGWVNVAICLLVLVPHAAVMAAAAHATLAYALAEPQRLLVLLAWVAAVGVTLPVLAWLEHRHALPHIVLRKGFHVLAFAMFSPVLVSDPILLSLALAVAFVLMALVELVRALRVPIVSGVLSSFMSRFTDSRDSGVFLVSHMSLLLGIAVPIWVCSSLDSGPPGRHLAAWAGLVALGLSDTAAAAVGSAWGRVRVHRTTRKTLEGTLAASAFMMAAMLVLVNGDFVELPSWSRRQLWGALLWRSLLTCGLEAVTPQLDNIVFPVHAYTLFASVT
jgi:dolichol kinase